MRKTINNMLSGMVLLCGICLFSSCESYDEVPPRKAESVQGRKYKLPDIKLLSADEQAQVKQIQAEYNASQK